MRGLEGLPFIVKNSGVLTLDEMYVVELLEPSRKDATLIRINAAKISIRVNSELIQIARMKSYCFRLAEVDETP